MNVYVRRFLGATLFGAALLLFGTSGYMAIEGWRWGDSLYMTIITLTAVGYEEVHPLSNPGRVFTGFLLAGGITGLGLWFAFLTSFIVELDLKDVIRRRRLLKEVKKMKDHVIVCGSGRTGSQVIEELLMAGEDFVVVERDREKVEQLRELMPEVSVIEGDATMDHFLEEARVDRARGLIACLSADTDNLFVCLTARDLRSDIEIIARAFEEENVPKLYRAGANHVVSPNASGAIRMASFMLRPSVVSFLDVATRSPDLTLRLEQETVSESSSVAGKTLADAQIPQNTGLIVIALRKKKKEEEEGEEYAYVYNPVASTRLEPGDVMIVLGKPEQIETLRTYVNT
jgi:voltage-gated potassium channel